MEGPLGRQSGHGSVGHGSVGHEPVGHEAEQVHAPPVCNRASLLLAGLKEFYGCRHWSEKLLEVLEGKAVSLRLIDWLCTNYSASHEPDLHDKYNVELDIHKKSRFDPFKRKNRVQFRLATGTSITTTVAQLNFFRWALSEGIYEYAIKNKAAVQKDMMQKLAERLKRKVLLEQQRHRNTGRRPAAPTANKGDEDSSGSVSKRLRRARTLGSNRNMSMTVQFV